MKRILLTTLSLILTSISAHAASFHEICRLPKASDYPNGAEIDYVVTRSDHFELEVPTPATAVIYSLKLADKGGTVFESSDDKGYATLMGSATAYGGDANVTIFEMTSSSERIISNVHFLNKSSALNAITVNGVEYMTICDRQ